MHVALTYLNITWLQIIEEEKDEEVEVREDDDAVIAEERGEESASDEAPAGGASPVLPEEKDKEEKEDEVITEDEADKSTVSLNTNHKNKTNRITAWLQHIVEEQAVIKGGEQDNTAKSTVS